MLEIFWNLFVGFLGLCVLAIKWSLWLCYKLIVYFITENPILGLIFLGIGILMAFSKTGGSHNSHKARSRAVYDDFKYEPDEYTTRGPHGRDVIVNRRTGEYRYRERGSAYIPDADLDRHYDGKLQEGRFFDNDGEFIGWHDKKIE